MRRKKAVDASVLPDKIVRQLAAYALAASAAGVGALALAPAARASIVVDDTWVPFPGDSSRIFPSPRNFFSINGKAVLAATNFASARPSHAFSQYLALDGAVEHSASRTVRLNNLDPGPLAVGQSIGPGAGFSGHERLASDFWYSIAPIKTVGGPWANRTGYLGFKFESNSGTHFGWAKLRVTVTSFGADNPQTYGGLFIDAGIEKFAYDTVPGQTIGAGYVNAVEPGALTLSLLAMGAVGLYELRRRKLAAVRE